ncbi:MAG: hypothetical protein IT427_00575 [Pirellulales bacterium]|nr:hypothetical protein [Pirellulales bacterium]
MSRAAWVNDRCLRSIAPNPWGCFRQAGGLVAVYQDTRVLQGLLSLADIKCETRLGGLLKHFYREAA